MFRNYLISLLRNLLKNKIFSTINLCGLVLGISSCLIIFQYAYNELSYDDFHQNKDNVYRLALDTYKDDTLGKQWAAGCAGVGPVLKENLPEVIDFVKLRESNTALKYKNTIYKENRVYYASESFFNIFSYRLLKGIDSLVLKGPDKMVISESTAKKYFGEEDPIGKTMTMNGYHDFIITGVFEDPPKNSHMRIDVLYSFDTYVNLAGENARTSWKWYGFFTYILVRDGTDPKELEAKLPGFVESNIGEELRESNEWISFRLQPIEDIHLHSHLLREFEVNGDATVVNGLMIIAVFILLIAWLNYINLSTARSIKRGKEIGIRKVMGSSRSQLIKQFLLESIFLNVLASIMAVGLVIFLVPYFEFFSGKEIVVNLFHQYWFWLMLPLFILIGGILSGLYPAFVISGFNPVSTIKRKLTSSHKGQLLKKMIVVFQFMISIVLIAGTITVYRQINFMKTKDLGFNMEQTMIMKGPNSRDSTYFQICLIQNRTLAQQFHSKHNYFE